MLEWMDRKVSPSSFPLFLFVRDMDMNSGIKDRVGAKKRWREHLDAIPDIYMFFFYFLALLIRKLSWNTFLEVFVPFMHIDFCTQTRLKKKWILVRWWDPSSLVTIRMKRTEFRFGWMSSQWSGLYTEYCFQVTELREVERLKGKMKK